MTEEENFETVWNPPDGSTDCYCCGLPKLPWTLTELLPASEPVPICWTCFRSTEAHSIGIEKLQRHSPGWSGYDPSHLRTRHILASILYFNGMTLEGIDE